MILVVKQILCFKILFYSTFYQNALSALKSISKRCSGSLSPLIVSIKIQKQCISLHVKNVNTPFSLNCVLCVKGFWPLQQLRALNNDGFRFWFQASCGVNVTCMKLDLQVRRHKECVCVIWTLNFRNDACLLAGLGLQMLDFLACYFSWKKSDYAD